MYVVLQIGPEILIHPTRVIAGCILLHKNADLIKIEGLQGFIKGSRREGWRGRVDDILEEYEFSSPLGGAADFGNPQELGLAPNFFSLGGKLFCLISVS